MRIPLEKTRSFSLMTTLLVSGYSQYKKKKKKEKKKIMQIYVPVMTFRIQVELRDAVTLFHVVQGRSGVLFSL